MGVVIVILQLVSVIAGSILLAASILNLFNDEIVFWPPPFEGSWQHRTFLLLFRVMFYSLVALSSVLIWLQGLTVSISIFCVGLFLMVFGFGIALLATGLLGWRQAFGVKEGLRTEGLFSISRNPVYVATWFGMVGWSQLVPEPAVWLVLAQWALIYLIAIFLEERWLRTQFGAEFERYTKITRRIVGWRSPRVDGRINTESHLRR